jgi:tRNA pseudouridine55 synthase
VVQFLSGLDKAYEGEITLGKTSVTYDSEGVESDSVSLPSDFSREQIEQVLREFTGKLIQNVPAYSAVKVDGKRLYQMARRGLEIKTPEREVEIYSIDLLELSLPQIRIRVTSSKGTYIRSLAHDIGQRLGCGGYLSALKRTKVGRFGLEDACSLEDVETLHSSHRLADKLLDYDEVLDYAGITVADTFVGGVVEGKGLLARDVVGTSGVFDRGDRVVLKAGDGTVLAVGIAGASSEEISGGTNGNELFKYIRVLN